MALRARTAPWGMAPQAWKHHARHRLRTAPCAHSAADKAPGAQHTGTAPHVTATPATGTTSRAQHRAGMHRAGIAPQAPTGTTWTTRTARHARRESTTGTAPCMGTAPRRWCWGDGGRRGAAPRGTVLSRALRLGRNTMGTAPRTRHSTRGAAPRHSTTGTAPWATQQYLIATSCGARVSLQIYCKAYFRAPKFNPGPRTCIVQ